MRKRPRLPDLRLAVPVALVALVALAGLVPGGARADEPKTLRAEDAKVEKVAGGFRFTEGPASDADGNLYFSDIPNQRIHRLDGKTGKVTVFQEDSGRANGLAFDAQGRLIACEGGGRRVVRYEDGKRVVLAEKVDGKRLNSPNDLALDAKGGVYFTDPRYGKQEGRELEKEAVYYIAAGGTVTCVIQEHEKPNGILLSADGKTLYVADNRRKGIFAHAVKETGKPGKAQAFASMDAKGRGGPDGMTRDASGNVYAAGQGHVWIWDPEGKLIEKIAFPEGPSNCTFGRAVGGTERTTLYVTARTSLYRLAMRVKGG